MAAGRPGSVDTSLLPKTCSILRCREASNPSSTEQTFYMVGTAHVSTASCDDVREVIRLVKPEVGLSRAVQPCGESKRGGRRLVCRQIRKNVMHMRNVFSTF